MQRTRTVLYSLAIIAACWEMFTLANNTEGDSFSAVIRKLGVDQPFIIFAMGLTCGHLFWPLIDGQTQDVTVIKEKGVQ